MLSVLCLIVVPSQRRAASLQVSAVRSRLFASVLALSPEALDKGDFILAGIDGDHLLQAVDVAVEMNKNRDFGIPVPDYVDENVSDKVVKIIQSYTGVVNKMVWRKS